MCHTCIGEKSKEEVAGATWNDDFFIVHYFWTKTAYSTTMCPVLGSLLIANKVESIERWKIYSMLKYNDPQSVRPRVRS